ncbi:hypothetical protein [Arcobacter cloacae]|uniref:Uncharacterized protein n=1 Tax=Arcobacter cloacae TaxID=1054034 RepID=A0A6M8NFZ1_9BACT|nr:hypothetical protein [Arcobacter cloacae]QKF89219.1 hypothetical protein ACLO_0702 [Arcobacter cloacae]RXI42574.1 hypothetical protein CP963_03510 [Arcobacter cloacae]
MKKIILFLFIVVGFSGCQQALNDFNKSLAEFEQNLNSNMSNSNLNQNSLFEGNNNSNIQREKEELNNLSAKMLSEEEFYQEYDQYYKDWENILEKYAVKQTEQLSSINNKYNNSDQLFKEKSIDLKKLNSKISSLQDYKYSSYRNSSRFLSNYPLSKTKQIEEPYLMYIMGFGIFENTTTPEKYKSYLKGAYETYNDRQVNIAKKIEEKKVENEEKNKLLEQEKQIQKDRDKVKLVCEKWLKKAKQDVYSLGVGEKIVIMRNGKAVSTIGITKVERNTFLVGTYTLWNTYETFYVQKSDSIPYESLKTAPSPYCYK